ncbi:MAG: sulfite exporter TauE/SafE family protein [Candidatus Omnitrophica bacterium]|nr:sulfite exporter TauE/SafE family protein [Candidatus Omnitrophota bacterium]
MATASLLLFLAWAFVAEVIGTMAGFGAATVLTPIASLFMDIKTAIAVVACFHLFGNASRIMFFHRHINWNMVVRFGLPGIALSFIGAQIAAWLSADSLRLVLGGFLVLYALAEAFRATALRVPATTPTLLIGGIGSGFVAGVIGTGGAIRSACLLAFGLPKEAYIGTSAVIALCVDATRVPVYLTQQFIPSLLVPVMWSLTVVAFSGSFVGQWLVRRISPAWFKRFVLAMLLVMGVKLLIDGVPGVTR